jgi:hypothetical protein
VRELPLVKLPHSLCGFPQRLYSFRPNFVERALDLASRYLQRHVSGKAVQLAIVAPDRIVSVIANVTEDLLDDPSSVKFSTEDAPDVLAHGQGQVRRIE